MSSPPAEPLHYRCLPRRRVERGALAIESVQPDDIEAIRQWRNAQMAILRQDRPLSPDDQRAYYAAHVWPAMAAEQPANILVSILEHGRLVGYGGLVHIHWAHRRAEISFLLDPALTTPNVRYGRYFQGFLDLIRDLAFTDLKLHKLTTESYDLRPYHLSVLDRAGFARDGVLRDHVRVDGRFVDAVAHSCLAADHRGRGASRAPGPPGHVLVTSAGAKAPLIRAVKAAARAHDPQARVIAGDVDPAAPSFCLADDGWTMPAISDATMAAILDGCAGRGVGLVIPTRDGELGLWAAWAARAAERGIHVAVSPPAAVARCLDKLAFARAGRDAGWPVIPAVERVADAGPGPLVVKERWGSGSRSVAVGLSPAAAEAHAATLSAAIVQPQVAGVEISADAWLDRQHRVHGGPDGVVLRRRERVVAGESQVTVTFRHPDHERTLAGLLESLELSGPVVAQAIVDADDRLHVIEVNPRFGGASTAGIAAGLDPFGWTLAEAAGRPLPGADGLRRPGRVHQTRLAADHVVRLPDDAP
ncbi:carbamoylphosphate synthase large subunit [Rhodothalassium salexigens DSM 2132]|uniref:Carbamoylphosphate synthase large subunit n=1 Tax=Rhodothalassium salexigens DSM 2132 TaxID=1188247 RepID=A0A4R2PBY4_RHOSA|nr:GNAT family N-acetyltransferase [Rhodothalassium salexigens]MBB4212267.1 RimJ/RimL family protein N-acetyltransferase [Rhodothalassium salexigens DSM 2132]TCP32582.1 carbamoylphosphate synthase large subunit [Rhodothalassium salexigens DSM 2132]